MYTEIFTCASEMFSKLYFDRHTELERGGVIGELFDGCCNDYTKYNSTVCSISAVIRIVSIEFIKEMQQIKVSFVFINSELGMNVKSLYDHNPCKFTIRPRLYLTDRGMRMCIVTFDLHQRLLIGEE